MRVVLAPDCFTRTATSAQAAAALAAGWRSVAAGDTLVL
jgi:glycerate kinase